MYPATVTAIIVINVTLAHYNYYVMANGLTEQGNDHFRMRAIQIVKIKTCLLNDMRERGMRGALHYMTSPGK